jgi:hypothetical protein
MNISQKAIDFIIAQEVGSERDYNPHPEYAGGDSGCTIGIGFDCGYNSAADIQAAWGDLLAPSDVALLKGTAGFKGEKCLPLLTPSVKRISVPFAAAKKVFTEISIPKFYNAAKSIYPQIGELNADTQGALVSMVYNRGASIAGSRRVHMANIVPLVAAKDYKGIAAQIEASKTLWIGKGLDGLISRREGEARLILDSLS